MFARISGSLSALAICLAAQPGLTGELVSPALTDGMMVQADQPIRVWGEAAPGQELTVAFDGAGGAAKATANRDGRWMAELPARKAGETFAITITPQSGSARTLSNLMAGDIWLCSGQSNMDMMVKDAANAPQVEARSSRYPIRVAKVRRASLPAATSAMTYDIAWSPASAESIAEFSSACWHMGEEIVDRTGRPLGLIHSAWGGTTVEDWIDATTLGGIPGNAEAIALLNAYAANPQEGSARSAAATEAWIAKVSPENATTAAYAKADTDIAGWPTIDLPQMWEQAGIEPLSNFNGIVWFARDVMLTKAQTSGSLVLDLERIDERDTVWVNGKLVGAEVDPNQKRLYTVPQSALREGRNRIAIRVVDERGSGGFRARPDRFLFRPKGGDRVSLAGAWHYRIGAEIKGLAAAPPVPWKAPRGFTTLYNGMIAPLAPMPMKGVAWYQGESNTGTGMGPVYRDLLKGMMRGWRLAFGQPALPFVIAQLPGFGGYDTKPEDSGWAELREGQRAAVAQTDNAGLAVLIDSGEEEDIHPRHKTLVGERLATEAIRVAYGDAAQPVAPYPTAITRNGGDLIVRYPDNVRFEVVSALDPTAFQLCTAAGNCQFARARIEDNTVIVSGAVADKVEVRYAWEDTPIVNLYAKNGLPAAPFKLAVGAQ